MKLENQFFKEDWQAILNFYVFSQICDAKIYPGGVTNLLKITQQHQFFPKLTEVETEMNVLLPLNKASDKLQLTFVRYTNFLVHTSVEIVLNNTLFEIFIFCPKIQL